MRAAHYRSMEKIRGLCLKQLCRARSASGLHKGLAEASMATESEFKVSLHLSVCFSPAGVVPQTTPRETPWIQVFVPESISRELVPEVCAQRKQIAVDLEADSPLLQLADCRCSGTGGGLRVVSTALGMIEQWKHEAFHWQQSGISDQQMGMNRWVQHLRLWRGLCMHACSVTSVMPTLCNPKDGSLPGFSVHRILQARIREWVTLPSSRGSSQPRDRTHVSYISCFDIYALYH